MVSSKGMSRWRWTGRQRVKALPRIDHEPVIPIRTIQHEGRAIELIDMRPETLVEILGEDLMLGADQNRIIERLSAAGIVATPDLLAQIDQIAAGPAIQIGRRLALKLRKRSWLLDTLFRLADDAGHLSKVPRVSDLPKEVFFDEYYARNLPVIIAGAVAEWPAVSCWTPAYLKSRIGDQLVQVQGDRNHDPDYELYKDRHARLMPFAQFMDQISSADSANDLYMTAYNASHNADAFASIRSDMGAIDRYLDPASDGRHGLMWIGPAGTVTPMHHDLTNNLLVQVVGRKIVKLVPSVQADAMYNHIHVFSAVSDVESSDFDINRFPDFERARVLDVTLLPGDALFIPIGWWHQVRSLDFSVTLTFTNFHRNNSYHHSYPV